MMTMMPTTELRVQLDGGAYMPTRAHGEDAGLDIRTPMAFTLKTFESATIPTGVHVEIPEGCAGLLVSKSGAERQKQYRLHGADR